MFKKLVSSLFCLYLTSATTAAAQSVQNDTPKLYEVELIVFERLEQANQNDPERWPKDVSLVYPYPWQRLVDAEQLAELMQRSPARDESDRWRLSDELLERYGAGAAAEPPVDTPSEQTPENRPGDAPPDQTPTDAPAVFVYLPDKQRKLTAVARALNRASELRVLYHRHWHQELVPQNQAPALILSGGDLYGEHHELEGTLTLYLSRYIHLRTNLWLTQFVPNYGQPSEHWPALPTPPFEFSSHHVSIEPDIENLPLAAHDTETASLRVKPASSTSLYGAAVADQTLNTGFHSSQMMWEAPAPYRVNQIVTLKQARRMRSTELHYLDHPRLGLLIRVTPVEAPGA